MIQNFVYIIFVTVLVAEALGHDEPRCSKFHFEEKVLEKLVRFEHKMELIEKKMDNWDTDMKAQFSIIDNKEVSRTDSMENKISELNDAEVERTTKLNKLQEVIQKSVDEQQEKLEHTLTSFNQHVKRLSKDLMDKQGQINQTLLASIARQETAVSNIKDDLVTPTVVFKAKTAADTMPSVGSEIRYTETISNVGGGYDTRTGYFTAPHSGTYLFTVQVCPQRKNPIILQLIAADQIIGTVHNYEQYDNTCSSGTGVAILSVGDKVWVKCVYTGTFDQDARNWNSFSGLLIHTNTK